MFTDSALNQAADAIVAGTIKLHSGDPGAAGDQNLIASTETAITFGAATGGVRTQASALDIDVPATTVSHYTLWDGVTLKKGAAFSGAAEVYASPGVARVASATISVANPV